MDFRGLICVLGLSVWMLDTVRAASLHAPLNPGIKAHISERALSAVARSTLDSLKGRRLPDSRSKHFGFKCNVYGMSINSLTYNDTSVKPSAGQTIAFGLSKGQVIITGRIKCKAKKFIKLKYGFKIQLSGLDIQTTVVPGLSANGHLTSSVKSCTSSLPSISCSVSGSKFRSKVRKGIEKELKKYKRPNALCDPIKNVVNSKINPYLAKIPVEVPVKATNLFLNVRFLAAPSTKPGYIETQNKGEFFYGRDRSEASFLPQPMTSPKPSKKMIMVCASDYVINTLGLVLNKNGLLKYNFTKKNVPPAARGFLNTTCGGIQQCIGKVIPQIGKKFPNSSVEILTKATSAPTVHTAPDQVTGHLDTNIAFNIRQPNGKVSLGFDMKMALNVSGAGKIVNKNGYKITASVKNVHFDVRVIKSNVGKLSDSFLKTVFGMAVKMFIIPELNKLGMKGYPLPSSVGPAAIMNPSVSILKNTICFDTDARYKPAF